MVVNNIRVPSGYHFVPEDKILFTSYLLKKCRGEPIPDCPILELDDLYEWHPDALSVFNDSTEQNVWYFFTPRHRTTLGGTNPSRSAGEGFWRASVTKKEIKDGDTVLGTKQVLNYFDGSRGDSVKTHWIMYEYVPHEEEATRAARLANSGHLMIDSCVLCKLFKTPTRF